MNQLQQSQPTFPHTDKIVGVILTVMGFVSFAIGIVYPASILVQSLRSTYSWIFFLLPVSFPVNIVLVPLIGMALGMLALATPRSRVIGILGIISSVGGGILAFMMLAGMKQ